MAQTMSAQMLSATWACHRFSKRQQRWGQAGARPAKKPRKNAAQVKAKRRCHGRNPFQAYVADKSQGAVANFKALHREFRLLSPAERQKYETMAKNSARAPKPQGGARSRPFGLSLSDAARRAKKHCKVALWRKHRSTLSEAERGRKIFAEAMGAGATPEEAVRQAVCEFRFESQQERAQEEGDRQAVAMYAEENKSVIESALSGVGAAVSMDAEGFFRYPFRNAQAFEFLPRSANLAARALSFAKAKPASAMHTALEMDWRRRTSLVDAEGAALIPDPTRQEKALQECLVAGVCLCSPEGKVLKRFCSHLLAKGFKAACPPLSAARRLLAEGGITIALASAPPPPQTADVSEVVPPDCLAAPATASLWLHIGLMYLSPFRPTFQKLLLAPDQPADGGRVLLTAAGSFSGYHTTMEELPKDHWWWVHFCRLVDTVEPLESVNPREVTVTHT